MVSTKLRRPQLVLRSFWAGGLVLSIVGCAPSSNGGGTGGTTGTGGVGATTGAVLSGALGPWALTADYPLAANNCAGAAPNLYCAQQTCVASSGTVYCIGGESTSTYYSQLSSAGLGSWMPTADYPVPVEEESCSVSSDYIFCVGGNIGGADAGAISPTADVYYAPLSPSGIGAWTASTPYPYATAPQCMINSGYIYCISANSTGVGSPDAYYAPISSSGVGAWTPTAGPPTWTEGCSSIGGYGYCFGGGSCPPDGPSSDCYSPSYFAPLTPNGIGTWNTTTELPTAVSATYVTAGSYIYYLSIPVFFAAVSADGIGPWETTTNYPDSSYPSDCVSNGGYLYCASPLAGSSYFAQIGAPNPQSLQLEDPPPFPRSEYLIPAWTNGEGCSVSVNGVVAGAPCFGKDIDQAVVFDCASQASTAAGCATTVMSSNTTYNYDLTIWYPCRNQTPTGTNCCFLPALGYDTALYGWCGAVGSNSFIIGSQITLQQSQ
jgi:hypothetical protein